MLRWLRWHLAKSRLSSVRRHRPPGHIQECCVEHKEKAADFPPDAKGYERLALVWDDYASWWVPDYGNFLDSAGDYYGQPMNAVLDLACGTGLLTRQFARHARL